MKVLELMKSCFGLVFLLLDIAMVFACSILHFERGGLKGGWPQGGVTLGLFYVAGLITNIFHLFGHEWQRLAQQSASAKAKCYLFLVLPCSSLLRWYYRRCRSPESLSLRCWTSSLRLFYCTGTFMQAVMQSYVVVHLWWEQDLPDRYVYVPLVAGVVLSLHAMYGVCGYIWTAYYDETHGTLPALDYFFIVAALFLNMGGRVAVMAVVMGTLGWQWLALAVLSPLLINYAVYLIQAPFATCKGAQKVWLVIFMLPLGFLSAIAVSEKKPLTVLTTLAWLGCSVPQIYTYHGSLSEWLVWGFPVAGQVTALVIMMVKWSAFEAAFERFGRLARINKFALEPTKQAKNRGEALVTGGQERA